VRSPKGGRLAGAVELGTAGVCGITDVLGSSGANEVPAETSSSSSIDMVGRSDSDVSKKGDSPIMSRLGGGGSLGGAGLSDGGLHDAAGGRSLTIGTDAAGGPVRAVANEGRFDSLGSACEIGRENFCAPNAG